MPVITISKLNLTDYPNGLQTFQIRWRKKSDPDSAEYYNAAPNMVVDRFGNVVSPNPYQITVPQTTIIVKAANVIGCGAGLTKEILICGPVVGSGTVSGSCPEGYTLSEDGTYCFKIETMAPTITESDFCLAASPNSAYGTFGSRIYAPGFSDSTLRIEFPNTDTYIFANLSLPGQWLNNAGTLGPMNREAVWIDSDCDGNKDALASGVQTTIACEFNNTSGVSRTIYVGIGSDNQFILKVNGTVVATMTTPIVTETFKIWHIIPITVEPGINYINAVAIGDGSVNDAVGLVVYDNTAAQIQAATSDASLNIAFKSSTLIGDSYDIATCPATWSLDTSGGQGNYICKRILTTPPL